MLLHALLLLPVLAAERPASPASERVQDAESKALVSIVGCPSTAGSPAAARSFARLRSIALVPLCEDRSIRTSRGFVLRTTSFAPGEPAAVTYEARGSRLRVKLSSAAAEPGTRTFVSPLRPRAFRNALRSAGFDALWTASDADCRPADATLPEATMTWEFIDASGYRIRPGAHARRCPTPYREIADAIAEILREVQQER